MKDIYYVTISVIIILLLVKFVFEPLERLYYKIRYRKPQNKTRYKDYYLYKESNNTAAQQYTTKKILDDTEYDFYQFIKNECDNYDMVVLPKMKLEQFTNLVYTEQPVDFIICDQGLNIIAGIELESNSLETKAELIEKTFHLIKKPIFRIKSQKDIYQEQVKDIVLFLHEKYIELK